MVIAAHKVAAIVSMSDESRLTRNTQSVSLANDVTAIASMSDESRLTRDTRSVSPVHEVALTGSISENSQNVVVSMQLGVCNRLLLSPTNGGCTSKAAPTATTKTKLIIIR